MSSHLVDVYIQTSHSYISDHMPRYPLRKFRPSTFPAVHWKAEYDLAIEEREKLRGTVVPLFVCINFQRLKFSYRNR